MEKFLPWMAKTQKNQKFLPWKEEENVETIGRCASELKFLEEAIWDAYGLNTEDAEIMAKGEKDVVTTVDLEIETKILERIRKLYPDDAILSEEASPDGALFGRTWAVDPLDGTYNFSRGIPMHGTQAALTVDGKPVAEVLYLPGLGEMYAALSGGGAFMNGKGIHVSPDGGPGGPCVSFGSFLRDDDVRDRQLSAMKAALNVASHIRMFGSTAYDFAFLSSGRTQGCAIFSRNPWDLLPGGDSCRRCLGASKKSEDEPKKCGSWALRDILQRRVCRSDIPATKVRFLPSRSSRTIQITAQSVTEKNAKGERHDRRIPGIC